MYYCTKETPDIKSPIQFSSNVCSFTYQPQHSWHPSNDPETDLQSVSSRCLSDSWDPIPSLGISFLHRLEEHTFTDSQCSLFYSFLSADNFYNSKSNLSLRNRTINYINDIAETVNEFTSTYRPSVLQVPLSTIFIFQCWYI